MKLRIKQHSAAYWRATIDHPPLNLFDQGLVDELDAFVEKLEHDAAVKVVVFDSADPEYFMAHLDLLKISELNLALKPSGLAPWPDIAQRLESAPFITIGLVRGRARGVGSEFLQALDIRFASRERAIFSQIEVGCGLIPGGGGLERLPKLVGRARALEVIVGSDDFDADTAARYGWINRAIPDVELDAFVERFALRVASFEGTAIATAKQLINERCGPPTVADLAHTQDRFFALGRAPGVQARVGALLQRGLQQRGELELNLGRLLGPD